MHVVNWEGQDFDPNASGGFSSLYGEWPCVPFGTISAPAKIAAGWVPKILDNDGFFHGFSSHHEWQVNDVSPGHLALSIKYPEESPIDSLQREIQGDPHTPALTVVLRIRARCEVEMPVALHPTFRVPETGFLHISGGDPAQVHSYPWPLEPAITRLKANACSRSLLAVEGLGGPVDVSNLPLQFPAEELLQLEACQAAIRLDYVSEGASVTLDWDRRVLPDALLWISNGGRSSAPWNGRHFALGIEPVAGQFDLGRVATPVADHPLSNRLLHLTPDHEAVIRYKISANVMSDAKGLL